MEPIGPFCPGLARDERPVAKAEALSSAAHARGTLAAQHQPHGHAE
jgi:hypothetical protein